MTVVVAEGMIITIIIPPAYIPAMITVLKTIHRIPMKPNPMTAEGGAADVTVAGEVMAVAVEAVEAVAAVAEGIDRILQLPFCELLLRDAVERSTTLRAQQPRHPPFPRTGRNEGPTVSPHNENR